MRIKEKSSREYHVVCNGKQTAQAKEVYRPQTADKDFIESNQCGRFNKTSENCFMSK